MTTTITVACPTDGCQESHPVEITMTWLNGTLTESCDGCGEHIWTNEPGVSVNRDRHFTVYSGDNGPSVQYERVSGSDEFEVVRP